MSSNAPLKDETLERMFRGEADALYRVALRLLGSREEAEDAVQDAYLRVAYPAKPQPALQHPRGWMFRILRNLCIDRLRSRKSRLRVVTDDQDIETLAQHPTSGRTPESDLIATDALERVARGMDALPPDLAEVLSLIVVEGLSYQEASTVIGIPVGTVRSRLSRARASLKTLLEDKAPARTPLHLATPKARP